MWVQTSIFGVPDNFLDVVSAEFYIPTDIQQVDGAVTLPDGRIDAVGLLYSDADLYQYPTYPGYD